MHDFNANICSVFACIKKSTPSALNIIVLQYALPIFSKHNLLIVPLLVVVLRNSTHDSVPCSLGNIYIMIQTWKKCGSVKAEAKLKFSLFLY